MSDAIESFLGKTAEGEKSPVPARLDFIQSASGLILGLFMWGHMFFVSSILISKDFMYTVSKMFEGSLFLSTPRPWIVSCVVLLIFIIFIVHAGLAMRKFPINFHQWQVLLSHLKMIRHADSSLWFVQTITGFLMFFFASFHLIYMFFYPHTIGPYGSGERMVYMWPFYLILLFAVELHGSIGLYRLCIKWGWFEGADVRGRRKKLKIAKWFISIFFLLLGLLTMAAYIKTGLSDHLTGSQYIPDYIQDKIQ